MSSIEVAILLYIYIYIYSTPFNDAPDDLLERIEREHEKA
jgi:hypothetical protein